MRQVLTDNQVAEIIDQCRSLILLRLKQESVDMVQEQPRRQLQDYTNTLDIALHGLETLLGLEDLLRNKQE